MELKYSTVRLNEHFTKGFSLNFTSNQSSQNEEKNSRAQYIFRKFIVVQLEVLIFQRKNICRFVQKI